MILFFLLSCNASLLRFSAGKFYPSGYPLPSTEHLIERIGYLSDLSLKLKMPKWVSEQLQLGLCRRATRDKCKFGLDPEVPKDIQATLADYKGNKLGLSRGHMSAASHHIHSQLAMRQTFYLSSNIVPQNAVLNGGDWLRLERLHQKLGRLYKDCPLYVIQGPLWLPSCRQIRMTGPNKLLVPTHFFKAAKLFDGAAEASAAFLIPNKPLRTNNDLNDYKVDPREIELSTGLNLMGIKSLNEIAYPSVSSIQSAKAKLLAKKIKKSRDMKELSDLVMTGLKVGLFDSRDPQLIQATRSRGAALLTHADGNLVDAILKGNDKYRPALIAALRLSLNPKP